MGVEGPGDEILRGCVCAFIIHYLVFLSLISYCFRSNTCDLKRKTCWEENVSGKKELQGP